jgi:hypothetical protein
MESKVRRDKGRKISSWPRLTYAVDSWVTILSSVKRDILPMELVSVELGYDKLQETVARETDALLENVSTVLTEDAQMIGDQVDELPRQSTSRAEN